MNNYRRDYRCDHYSGNDTRLLFIPFRADPTCLPQNTLGIGENSTPYNYESDIPAKGERGATTTLTHGAIGSAAGLAAWGGVPD
jgi:hypothetical protein